VCTCVRERGMQRELTRMRFIGRERGKEGQRASARVCARESERSRKSESESKSKSESDRKRRDDDTCMYLCACVRVCECVNGVRV